MVDVERTALQADFHTHSTASDGTLAPAELIYESARRGLSHVALTDHDTTGGIREAVDTGTSQDIVVIPGIEFSTHVERGELHILGYGINPDYEPLQQRIEMLRRDRLERAERILERLQDLGIALDPAIIRRTRDDDSIGRPHIARALIEAGVVESVSEGFDRYLGRGKPAFVEKRLIPPEEAIQLIHASGGIAVMAHPFSVPQPQDVLPKLITAGLDGIECFYGEYSQDQREALVTIANEHDLIPTGGSDYHGPGFREGRDLGSVDIPESAISALLSAISASMS